jgi:nitroreductase
MMDVIQAIKLRKSVRSFSDKNVESQTLVDVLEMARIAPSFLNRQEWRFVIVRDVETRKKLVEIAKCSSIILESPIVIIGCGKPFNQITDTDQSSNIIDTAIALDHVSLAAIEYSLGTCWTSIFDESKVKEILGIPKEVNVVALMALGYPKDSSMLEKKRLSLQQLVKFEKW